MGGLGNQLFQLATAYGLCRKYSANLELNLFGLQRKAIYYPGLKYELRDLHGSFPFVVRNSQSFESWVLSGYGLRRLATAPVDLVNRIRNNASKPVLLIESKNPKDDLASLRNLKFQRLVLLGNWQRADYFGGFGFEFRQAVIEAARRLEVSRELETGLDQTNSIAVHIRGGDFLGSPKLLNLSREYFTNAVEGTIATNGLGEPELFVFTDDREHANSVMPRGYKTTLVEPMDAEGPFGHLYALSRARHLITSNSTFSWWAAFMHDNTAGSVTVPEKWYRDNRENGVQLLRHWNQVPTGESV